MRYERRVLRQEGCILQVVALRHEEHEVTADHAWAARGAGTKTVVGALADRVRVGELPSD
jgi:hypothetical protein